MSQFQDGSPENLPQTALTEVPCFRAWPPVKVASTHAQPLGTLKSVMDAGTLTKGASSMNGEVESTRHTGIKRKKVPTICKLKVELSLEGGVSVG